MRAAVVVVLHPVADAFPRFLERLEAGAHQELLLQRLPEPLDLAQRHRMLRRAADVVDVIALKFLLELRLAPPTGVLPPVVGQHFLRRAIGRHRLAIDLHHVGAGLAAEHPQAGDVPRVVIEESDDVRRAAQDGEVRDVALPHLVRRGTLEPARRGLWLPAHLRPQLGQPRGLQMLAYRLGTGLQEEPAPQDLRDPLRPPLRFGLLQLRDLRLDRHRELCALPAGNRFLQSAFPVLPVEPRPIVDNGTRDAQFPGNEFYADALFQPELYGAAPHFVGIRGVPPTPDHLAILRKNGRGRNRARAPPRGRTFLQLPLDYCLLFHR